MAYLMEKDVAFGHLCHRCSTEDRKAAVVAVSETGSQTYESDEGRYRSGTCAIFHSGCIHP